MDLLIESEFATLDANLMSDETLHRSLHIDDLDIDAFAEDATSVGVLATRFRVERRAVKHDRSNISGS